MTEEDAAAVIGQAREFLTTVKQLLAEEGVGLILSQLARCVGALPASQKKLIGKLDLPKLEALGESLLEFKSRADLSLWLKKERLIVLLNAACAKRLGVRPRSYRLPLARSAGQCIKMRISSFRCPREAKVAAARSHSKPSPGLP